MANDDNPIVNINNTLDEELVVFTVTSAVSNDSNIGADDLTPDNLYPVYTKIGTVGANQKKSFQMTEIISKLAIGRSTDDFPITQYVTSLVSDKNDVTVTSEDLNKSNEAFSFYKTQKSTPYDPIVLQFNEIILDYDDVSVQEDKINQLFAENNMDTDYDHYTLISYWAENSLYAWPGTYYCYAIDQPQPRIEVVLPKTEVGRIIVGNGTAYYKSSLSDNVKVDLRFEQGVLHSSDGKTSFTAVLRDMQQENQSKQIDMFWIGKTDVLPPNISDKSNDGSNIISQPYQTPQLAWWMIAYDLSYTVFLVIQLAMLVDMAKTILGSSISVLSDGAEKLYQLTRTKQESLASEADPAAEADADIELINVDVDIDVDVDVDVDVDTDNVVDTDVEVDIDIDVDIDDDVFAVIDVDVDVDVDVNVDVVTDTDNVVDTDNVTDIDIDTDIDVTPNTITGVLNNIGDWLIKDGLKALFKNAIVIGGMYGAQKALEVWDDQAHSALEDMSPQEVSGLGSLIDYMQNDNVSLEERWNTFADYVKNASPSPTTDELSLIMSSILMTKNDLEDQAQKDFSWPQQDEDNLVNYLTRYNLPSDDPKSNEDNSQYMAYKYIATYLYNGKTLPLKVSCSVIIKYLAKIV